MSRHVRVTWPNCANIVATRNLLLQDIRHLNPVVDRDTRPGTSAGAATIGIDVSQALASTDMEACNYALSVLEHTLGPGRGAEVLDVSLDATLADDPEPVPEVDAAPGEEGASVIDVDEVTQDEGGAKP